MTREEAINHIKDVIYESNSTKPNMVTFEQEKEALNMAIKVLEQEPCCNCIEFKGYAKQMGFKIETQPIPYLMHKEMDIPLLECQKAYDVAIEYLRSQGTLKG